MVWTLVTSLNWCKAIKNNWMHYFKLLYRAFIPVELGFPHHRYYQPLIRPQHFLERSFFAYYTSLVRRVATGFVFGLASPCRASAKKLCRSAVCSFSRYLRHRPKNRGDILYFCPSFWSFELHQTVRFHLNSVDLSRTGDRTIIWNLKKNS